MANFSGKYSLQKARYANVPIKRENWNICVQNSQMFQCFFKSFWNICVTQVYTMKIGASSRFPTQIKVRVFEVGTGLSETFNVMCVEVGNGLHNTDKLVAIGIHFEKLIVKIEPKTFKCRLVHMVVAKLM